MFKIFKSLFAQNSILNRQPPIYQTERHSKELYKMKYFYSQKGVGTKAKKKNELFIARLPSFKGWQGSLRQII